MSSGPEDEAGGFHTGSTSQNSSAAGFTGLIGQIGSGFLRLIRDELLLAKLEAREAARSGMRGIVLLVIALVLMLFALGYLLSALRDWLIWLGLHPGVAGLAIAGGLILIGLALTMIGVRALKRAQYLAPRRFGLGAALRASETSPARHLRPGQSDGDLK